MQEAWIRSDNILFHAFSPHSHIYGTDPICATSEEKKWNWVELRSVKMACEIPASGVPGDPVV